MIKENSIAKLLDIVDIVDVVERYVPLKKSGANFVCICPFHDDKNPSMAVSQSKQIFHCFSCKAGGNAIKFVMDYEGINYPSAITKLAEIYNFHLEYTNDKIEKKDNKNILEKVNNYYRFCLRNASKFKDYLKDRGINDDSIDKFQIGFAPSNKENLRFLQNENITIQDAKECGLVKENEKGFYASFINRISFPIYNDRDKLVGFGGRTLNDDLAKYVNSPESEIFDKSKIFYGYNLAKREIFKKGQIIICEGYLDVIMLHQAGIKNAVAVLGTALTAKHLPLIKKNQIKVVLCFDGDSAGLNAANKSSILLLNNSIDAQVAILNNNEDPADMVKNNEINKFNKIIDNGMEIGEFCIRQIMSKFDLNRPILRQKCLDEINELLKSLPNLISQSYRSLVARIFGISVSKVNNFNTTNQSKKTNFEKKDILELSILKTILEKNNLSKIFLNNLNELHFMWHKNYFLAIKNPINENLNLIRELEFESIAKKIENENEAYLAINNLKLKYYEKLREDLTNSDYEDKIDKILKLNKIIQELRSKR